MPGRDGSPRRVREFLRGLMTRRGIDGRMDLGGAGERLAAGRLRKKGYRVLARNLRVAGGELDLVTLAPDRTTIVFVEVKTRRVVEGRASPPPEASITAKKRANLLALAQRVSSRHGWSDRPLRIDVVAIDWPERGEPAVRHYENAVTPVAGRPGAR